MLRMQVAPERPSHQDRWWLLLLAGPDTRRSRIHATPDTSNTQTNTHWTTPYATHDVPLTTYVPPLVATPNIFKRATVQSWHNKTKAAGLKGMLIYNHFFETKGSHLKRPKHGIVRHLRTSRQSSGGRLACRCHHHHPQSTRR